MFLPLRCLVLQKERAHLTVGGIARSIKSTLEQNINKHLTQATGVQTNKWELGPEHVLIPWLIRHAAFCTNVFQVKANGKTAYFSQRGKDYNGGMIAFGEVGLFKVITEDKFEDRWEKGFQLENPRKLMSIIII